MKSQIIASSTNKKDYFSLFFEQERMWFLDQLEPGNPAYNIRGAIQIKGRLNAGILEQSINEIIRRHEILRTTFNIVDEQPRQIIGAPFRVEVPVVDLQKLSATEREQEAMRLATQVVQQPFNLSDGPLWRISWLLLEETQHILVLSMHQIVCDGDLSIGIFFREIAVLCEAFSSNQPSPLSQLPIQYKEFTLCQREHLVEERLEAQLAYWKQQLGDNLPILQLPTDHPRPPIQTYPGACQKLKLSKHLTSQLKLLKEQQGVTLFALLLAAFKTLLYRYTRQEDIIVGSPVSSRHLPETEELIGYFGNPLVLRTEMSGNPTFLELLTRVVQVISQAEKHQDYPFQKLVEQLKPERDMSIPPLFQVLFILRDDLMPTLELPSFTLTTLDVESTFVPYDLCISIKDTDSGLIWTWEYNTDLFEAATITRLLKHFQNLLESIVANLEGRIGELSILTEAERHQLLVEWNNTKTEYPQVCIHKRVEAQIEQSPDAVAVVWENQQLTYGELNCRANQLAHYLQKLGVKPEGLVGICLERSPQMMVAILAVLKAGGAYVPLDPAYPKERLEYMLSDANVQVLLTTQTLLLASSQIAEIAKNQEVVCLDSEWEIISTESESNPVSQIQPHNLAYVIYTSGSTGLPKGVMMEHLALSNLIDWHVQNRTKKARTLQFASFSFDISFHEIFSTWCSLGTLVLISEDVRRNPEALLNFIVERKIEKIYLPFVALQQLAEVIDDGTVPTSLREIITAGEQLQITPAIANFLGQTGCTLHNHYGATECQDVTSFTLTGDANSWPTLPAIGRSINNIQTYILDEFYQPVPIGVPGELYIGGDGIARGYFNRSDLTQEKFIPNPFTAGRLYKTGDLARILGDGNIEHLGRVDRQVKIRGFRIEMGEIEGLLAKHPTVRESAVIATEDVPGNKRLIAYVVPIKEQITSQQELTLRNYLKENLPDYMMPSVIVMLDKMPLTPSGKIDRRALPLPDNSRPELEAAMVIPQSDTEKLIAEAWQEVLQLEEVGIYDNFFELGGNSLLLIQVHKKIIEIFGSGLPTVALFQYPTIYALAQHLSQKQAKKPTAKRHKSSGRRTYQRSDIAIIGMSGRFPGAENIEAFWQNLQEGVESISWFSDGEIELDDLSLLNQPNYVKAGAVLPNIDLFDAEFFGYSAREAEFIDPQQRIFLECAWSALENAGYNPKVYGGLTGVYAGSAMSTYLINNVCPNQGFSPRHPLLLHRFSRGASELQVEQGNGGDHLPMRVSYKLKLTGPSISVQTTCSTSLVAVHLAIQSLQSGECDMALAGGVSIFVPDKVGYLFQEGMILSPDGHCRAFDAQAKGTVFGNGVGIVVLKRLDEAIASGDNIYAVIKGSAINNDGADKVGYTAPSVEGQAAAIATALAVADIDASTVSYVETHGTATPLGDPIEIAALTKAFRESTDTQKNGFCAIGSVKTNVGHLDEAAGIAGLIKTVLALKHKSIPPSLHFQQPNPNIDFANSPFYVNTALTAWKTNGTPRRAGVSSFGMGGTNCHVVLEEAPDTKLRSLIVLGTDGEAGEAGEAGGEKVTSLNATWDEQVISQNPEGGASYAGNDRTLHILTLSAKTEKALEELAQHYVDYLESDLNTELADICFTANTGRQHFNYRWAVVGENKQQFQQQLVSLIQSKPKPQLLKTTSNKRIAFLFTGQGSQYAGMGRQLYETQPTFRKIINRCDEILRPYLEQPLLSVLYPDNQSDHSKLDETAYTQPALFALEYALAQLWKSWGIEPDVVMGHSVGEYVAACLAGVFSLEDGLKLIATRGKLMQTLPQDGEMVALLTDEARATAAIEPYSTYVSIAAINAPNSVVISGQREAINAICTTLESSGIKIKKLNVSHAFHSPLMSPMLGEFERVAQQVKFSAPKIKLISNVTGTRATEEITTPDYWCRHIRQPVQFARCVESLKEQEIDVFVEMGAKPILLGMARQCLPEHMGLWLPSLRPDREDWQELLNSLAQLYVHGVPIDWVGFNLDYTCRRVPLPTYPFQRQRYWVEAPKDNGTKALVLTNNLTSSRQHPLLGQKLCLPGTKQIRFQGQISKNFPNWLQDHRVFETTIVPGTAYIEMALAAGVAVGKAENITVENVVIQQALILPDDGSEKIIHLVLTSQENLDYTFEIFSLETTKNEASEEPKWILHASGNLLVKDKQFQGKTIDLALLKSQCQEEVSPEILYQRNEEQNINYGESFRALAQVWRQGTVVLGKISLPEQLRTQVGDYQLHPVLLDASLQVLDATFLEDDYENTYVPVGVERLLLYSRPSADIWCYAQLRQGEDRSKKTISADFRLFGEDGELIAIVEGFQLKNAPRDAMLGTQEKSWQNWLYEMEWRPQRQDNPSQDQTQSRWRDNQKPRNWLILADDQGTGQELTRLLHSQGDNCTIIFPATEYEQIGSTEFRINPANPNHFQQLLQTIPTVAGVVHLWSLDAPEILSATDLEMTFKTCCGSTLHLVQELVKNYTETPRLWLVTRGAQAVNGYPVEQVAQSPLWGMGKVIALEHSELKCVRVDLDPIATGNDALELFEEIISSLSAEDSEDQVAYRDRARYVPRLVRDRQSQKTLGQTQLDVPENQPFRLEISSRGSLDNLKLLLTTRQKPKAGEIEIRVHTTGLNFRDVLNALSLYPGNPPLGIECAGEVVALGEGVKGFELGESVLGLASGSFSQYVTVDANFVVPKPAALTYEEAATIPEAFLTAYWCLHHVAKISAGDRVLIHAAAGGVGQAAVQLAILAGAEVFATASPSKWELLKSQGVKYIMNSRTLDFAEQVMAYTNGQGVDIVLNSLTGEGFVERSLAVVSAKGRFVELAKLDIWNSKQVARVRPDVQYFAIDMGSACQEQPALVQSMLRQLIQQFENGSLLPLPQTVFPLIDAVSAFRYMQQAKHIGKIVIKFPDKIGTQERLSLRSDGTYLITGGLGGLGLLVAQWLVERGAKHLVLLSRSGRNPSASDQLQKLEQAGACVKIVQADVSDSKQLERVWGEIELFSPPLRGIIHAAGILDDGVLLQQNWQRFASVMAPKVQGAWNLHRLTQNKPIDFFVLFSSSSSLLGTGGQPNYAAANAFLDALASYRRMLLLPGLSINWGAWAEVGMTARLGLVEQLNRKGEESIAPQQGLQVLEQLLLNPPVQVGVMPVNWSRFLQQRRVLSPFFADLAAEIQQLGFQSTSVTPQEGDSLKNTLLSRTPAERQQLLESRITEQVARVLGFSATKFDRQDSLINLGLDSLMAIELRSWLNEETGVQLPVMKIMQGPSISQLAELILEELALAKIMLDAPPSTELAEQMEEITWL